ncbi:MAG: bifunctional methylenetetrahydrofolate dehydrogenase/methenyltetrahydrofolate cyclohydrolase [Leptospiraceae bacterium]|nr:bifunctional methylenetetrahydrofolate dehydrogenase/methenyltetrahydrofolate cyclohydrolase [Leptospiraceae bacterium]MCK6379641.1 bifunctional methylenetetrahydrofolate dehydrogenase/methenyltetrahydrofolate cyclohydrolase [Leptospiraceae bacterium]NUM40095.1 bifunctional methylenetetrahydrofolate dehydrogenase/methenyltetrahydrofolate cyclohydrolase [Leptospiraceae bacterium]
MTSILIDGKTVSEKIKSKIRNSISILEKEKKQIPSLATILVGEDSSSVTYVNMKIKACEYVGMKSKLIKLPQSTSTEQLIAEIEKLNQDENIDGILLQHPCPKHIDERLAFDSISVDKDVDGVTTHSFGKLSMGEKSFLPCTPYGILLLLKEYKIPISGKNTVIVGRSPILGKPMAMLLLNEDATVTICHSKTKNLPEIVKNSDIVVGALGKPEFIQKDWIKRGAVLLDAGYNPGNVGDIDIKNGSAFSSYHTPVPGGVGPMTIAVLLWQTLLSRKKTLQEHPF